MYDRRAFLYAVCGGASHIRTLHRSLACLRSRTTLPIYVVTDLGRNEIAIDHPDVIDIRTPEHLSHHRASIFLKTSLHRALPQGPDYAYLDTDVLALAGEPGTIFDHRAGAVTFARDLNWLESRVGSFSPWAVHCGCAEATGTPCAHLSEAIAQKFGPAVPEDWLHWNGGVFVFGPEGAEFLDTWHRYTMEIFSDPYWKTRDQGTLIATVWKLGLEHQPTLPQRYNFIADFHNPELRFDPAAGYALHARLPAIRPVFLHLSQWNLDAPDWTLHGSVEEVLAARNPDRGAVEAAALPDGPAIEAIARQLGERVVRPEPSRLAPDYRVIVTLPRWTGSAEAAFCATLVKGLVDRGFDSRLLLTEQADAPALPLPVSVLARDEAAGWGARWGALVRYLEEASPCIFLPVGDWRNSTVCSQLSAAVKTVGLVQDDPRSDEEAERLGRYWAGALATSIDVKARLAERQSDLARRMAVLPCSMGDGGSRTDDSTHTCLQAFRQAMDTPFVPPKGLLRMPPYQAGGIPVLPAPYVSGIRGVGVFPFLRTDYEDYRAALGFPRNAHLPLWSPALAEEYPVILGASATPDSTRFVEAMAEGLARSGRPAQVLVAPGAPALHFGGAATIPTPIGEDPWLYQWRALAAHLETHAPCLYLPGAHSLHSAVCPHLSGRVGIVARIADPAPHQLRRAARMATHWDAVVADTEEIAERLLRLKPALAGRLVTIPLPGPAGDGASRDVFLTAYSILFDRVLRQREAGNHRQPRADQARSRGWFDEMNIQHRGKA